MAETNKTVWEWQGKDELTKILKGIDEQIVKIDKDTVRMERDMDKAMKGSGRSVDYLRDRIKRLQEASDRSFDKRKVAEYNREIDRLSRQIESRQRLGRGGLSGAMQAIPFGNTIMAGMANPFVLGGMAAAGMGKMVSDSVRYSRNFNEEMAKINATAQITPEALIGLRQSFFGTANRYSLDVDTLPAAYEAILSATGDKRMADRVFDPALRLGKAGFTDAKTTGMAIAQLMMTPGVNMGENAIADLLMAAKNYGKGELGDFARYLPGLIGMGKAGGFTEQEVTGTYAYLTRSNSSEQADTLLKNFLKVIGRPEVTSALKQRTGFDVYDANKQVKPLTEIVKGIEQSMKGLSDSAKREFMTAIKVVDLEAALAFSNLTSGADELRTAIETMNGSAGTLNQTLKFVETGNEALVEFSNNWKLLKNNMGNAVAPTANALVMSANNLITGKLSFWDLFDPRIGSTIINPMEREMEANAPRNRYNKFKQDEIVPMFAEGDVVENAGRAIAKYRDRYGKHISDQGYINIHKSLIKEFTKQEGQKKSDNIPNIDPNAERLTEATKHRTVRNVTVNIDTLMKVDKVAVRDSEGKSVDSVLEEIMNGLVKVIRDSEQAVETY
jgi:hypothetical protein